MKERDGEKMEIFRNQNNLTAFWEQGPKGGCALDAYLDVAGIPTIGFGSTKINGKPVTMGMKITLQCAQEQLVRDLMYWEVKIDELVGMRYPTHIIDAICDYAYNLGFWSMPNLLKKMKGGDVSGASTEFLNGIYYTDPKTNSKVPARGLLMRRISNYNTFLGRGYIAWGKDDPISEGLKGSLLVKNSGNQAAIEMINQLRVE